MANGIDPMAQLFNPQLMAQYRAMLEPPQEAKRAAGMDALLALGLGLLGNRSPHLGVAVGNAGVGAMGAYKSGMDSARANRMGELQGAMGLRKLQKDVTQEQYRDKAWTDYRATLPESDRAAADAAYYGAPDEFMKWLAQSRFPKPTDFQQETRGLPQPDQSKALRVRWGLEPKPELPSWEGYGWADRNKLTFTPDKDAQEFKLLNSSVSAPRNSQTIINKNTDELRKEFMGTPAYKNYETVQRSALAARAAAKKNDKASDYDLIISVAKVVDPESVVRESEFSAWGSAQTWDERLKALVQQARGGGVLTPSGRKKLLDVVENRANAAKIIFDATKKGYSKITERRGLPAEELFFPELEVPQAMDFVTPEGKAAWEQYGNK